MPLRGPNPEQRVPGLVWMTAPEFGWGLLHRCPGSVPLTDGVLALDVASHPAWARPGWVTQTASRVPASPSASRSLAVVTA